MTTMLNNSQKVEIISEALPYIREFSGKTFVIKYGGASMANSDLKQQVINNVALLHYIGVKVSLVHGGGPDINNMLKDLNIESKFRDGIRITDKPTMSVVEMILTGKVQKELVSLLNSAGAKSIGISGKDANLFQAKRYTADNLDWGQTGEITQINNQPIHMLLENSYLPVISSIASDAQCESLNINADNAAYKVAISLKAEKLIFLTDTMGVLTDISDPSSLIPRLTISQAKELIKEGTIQGGMLPKINNAISALQGGVKSVHILNGKCPNALLLEVLTQQGAGTMILPDPV